MTLPGSSETLSTGGIVATHTISAKEYQVMMAADPDGHIQGTAQSYLIFQTPRVTTAAATDFIDLFNATGSGKIVRIRGIWPVVTITAANALFTFEFDVIRTSAVGTGGTVASFEAAARPAAGAGNIVRLSTVDAATLPAQITCRTLPTGGATGMDHLFAIGLTPEETNPSAYLAAGINWVPQFPYSPALELQEAEGIKIRQITATASTGAAFGWLIGFAVIP